MDMDTWMEESMNLSHGVLIDEKLKDASEEAIETGRLTPLIKEELWTKIQARRLSEGKMEMKVDFKKPPSRTLSVEEEKKVAIRRERNRIAARKCRSKRKDVVKDMDKELTREKERNTELKARLHKLELKKNELLHILSADALSLTPPEYSSAQGREQTTNLVPVTPPPCFSAQGREQMTDLITVTPPSCSSAEGRQQTTDFIPVTPPPCSSAQGRQQTTDFIPVTPPPCSFAQGRQQATALIPATPPACSSTPSPCPFMYFEQSTLPYKFEYTPCATPATLEQDESQVVPVYAMYPYSM